MKSQTRPNTSITLGLALGGMMCATAVATPPDLTPMERLGKSLFFDASLSNPAGQSCASCHSPATGFTFPDSAINRQLGTAPGVISGRFSSRAVPTISYSGFTFPGPPFYEFVQGLYVGGLFWDGHANSLEHQARFPFLGPNEMNNLTDNMGDPSLVVNKVANGPLAADFRAVFGTDAFSQPTSTIFQNIAGAIATYERSREVNPFNSKYDAFLAGRAEFTEQELEGLRLFSGTWTGRPDGGTYPTNALCMGCHIIQQIPSGGPDLFTNFAYQNTGIPRNNANPFYFMTDQVSNPVGYNPLGLDFVDYGLGVTLYNNLGLPAGNTGLGSDGRGDFLGINGQFRTPNIRNVDKRPAADFVKAYFHNGAIKSLEDVVHFYNTRNLTTMPGEVIDFTRPDPYEGLVGRPLWPAPEYPNPDTLVNAEGLDGQDPENFVNGDSIAEIGNLGLTAAQEAAIVAFLRTLSDGYFDPDTSGVCVAITSQPRSLHTCLNASSLFTVASSVHPATYQWRLNGQPIPGADTTFYFIVSAGPADIGVYDCVVTVDCGSVTSFPAELIMCPADFNCDDVVDLFDYLDFVSIFAVGLNEADFNHDRVVDFFDYLDFIEAFSAGC